MERLLLNAAIGRVVLWGDPLGRTLEKRQLGDAVREGGHDLHTAGAGADDPDAAAIERDAVVPTRTVEPGACEAVEPLDGRDAGVVQDPRCRDDDVGLVAQAVRPLQLPAT